MVVSLIAVVLFGVLSLPGAVPKAQDGSAALSGEISWLQNESHRIIRASKRTMKDVTVHGMPRKKLL